MSTLRPANFNKDLNFLQQVYASTREDEMQMVDWNQQQKQQFLAMQFQCQHQYYQEHYPNANYDIILKNNRCVGRLYVNRDKNEIRIIDIALLTKYRGKGIGSSFLNKLIAESGQKEIPICIHVEHNNPALKLYERLSFVKVEEQGVYFFMKRTPKGVSA